MHSMDGGDALLQAAAKHGCLFTINHNRRWEHVTRKLQRSVQEGLLGDLVRSQLHFVGHSRRTVRAAVRRVTARGWLLSLAIARV
jgi:predicted dehydrogenase